MGARETRNEVKIDSAGETSGSVLCWFKQRTGCLVLYNHGEQSIITPPPVPISTRSFSAPSRPRHRSPHPPASPVRLIVFSLPFVLPRLSLVYPPFVAQLHLPSFPRIVTRITRGSPQRSLIINTFLRLVKFLGRFYRDAVLPENRTSLRKLMWHRSRFTVMGTVLASWKQPRGCNWPVGIPLAESWTR